MGRVRYKYIFDRAIRIEEVVERFGATMGIEVTATAELGSWTLSALPFEQGVELSFRREIIWVVPESRRRFTRGYFLCAFEYTLRELGALHRRRRLPRYATRRWDQLSGWQRWLRR